MRQQNSIRISLLLWCFPFLCAAQADPETTPLKHEAGLSLVSISYKSGHDILIGNHVYILNGIMYKRHLGKHAIRLGAEYKHTDADVEGDVSGESRFLEGKFNLGYQLTFSDKAIRPYIAVDFLYLVSTFTSAFQGGYDGLYHGYDLDNLGLGFAPALGIYFRLTKTLSVSWEGNIEYQWVTEQGTLTRSNPDNFHARTTSPYHRTECNSYWNFVKRISLNYGF